MSDGPGFPRLWNRLLEELQRGTIAAVTNPLRMSQDSAGIRLEVTVPSSTPAAVADLAPFEPYQFTPAPESPQTSDWRTFKFHADTVNGQHPAIVSGLTASIGDDSNTTDNYLVLLASTTYRIYFEAVRAANGNLTAPTLRVNTTGWPGYPHVAEPSNMYFQLAGSLVLGDDTAKTAVFTAATMDLTPTIAPLTPFQVYQEIASRTATDANKVNIYTGLVNAITPSAISAVTVANATTAYFWLDCTIEDTVGATQGNVTAAVFGNGTTLPTQGDGTYDANGIGLPPTTFYVLVGRASYSTSSGLSFANNAGGDKTIIMYARGVVPGDDGLQLTMGIKVE